MKRTFKVHFASLSHFLPRFAFFVVSTGDVLGQQRTEASKKRQSNNGKNQDCVHDSLQRVDGFVARFFVQAIVANLRFISVNKYPFFMWNIHETVARRVELKCGHISVIFT